MSLPKSQEHEELEVAVNAVAADLADYAQLKLDLIEAQQRIAQGDGQLKFAHVPLGMGCSVEGLVKQPRLIQLELLEGYTAELTIPESLSYIAKKLPILERRLTARREQLKAAEQNHEVMTKMLSEAMQAQTA